MAFITVFAGPIAIADPNVGWKAWIWFLVFNLIGAPFGMSALSTVDPMLTWPSLLLLPRNAWPQFGGDRPDFRGGLSEGYTGCPDLVQGGCPGVINLKGAFRVHRSCRSCTLSPSSPKVGMSLRLHSIRVQDSILSISPLKKLGLWSGMRPVRLD